MVLRNQWKTLIIAFVLPYLQFLGCSLIGLGLGAISDSDEADDYRIARAAIDSVETGSTVTIIKRDGTTVKGDYSGVRKRPAKMYSKGYNLALTESDYDGYLPKLGEAAAIVTPQSSFEGLYLGVDRNFVIVQLKNEADTIGVCLDSVEVIGGANGQHLQGPELRQLVYSATILSKSYVLMWADRQTVAIPYEAVDSVAVNVSKAGTLTGFLVGLGIDAAVIACAAIEYGEQKKSCGKGATVGR